MPRLSAILAVLTVGLGVMFSAYAGEPIDGYVVRETGVGPLDASTVFDPATVERLLPPGLSVKWESVQFGYAPSYAVLRVWQGAALLMELESYTPQDPKVTGITVLTSRIADARGARVGARMKTLYRYGDRPDCIPGVGRFAGRAICHAPGSAHVFYVFGGVDPAPEGSLPSWADLAKWRLAAIMWSDN